MNVYIMTSIPNNEIWYTSFDDQIVTPKSCYRCIVSNTYENGRGRIVFDYEVKLIGQEEFKNCYSLTSIIIPDGARVIMSDAFLGCFYLTNIEIPNSVTKIGNEAFSGCSSLTNIEIPNSVTEIGECVFKNCLLLSTFNGKYASDDNRSLIDNGKLLAFAPYGLTEYTIPDSVTEIGACAFSDCSNLTSIAIPNSVTEIGGGAFSGCSSLTSITIPSSVTKIGQEAFYGCSSLTSIVIPNSVTEIGERAFSGCSSLISITIPNSVTQIGFNAFQGCDKLTCITILNLYKFDQYRFENNVGLALVGHSRLTAFVGEYASEDNRCLIIQGKLIAFAPYGLTEYTIPDSVTEIGERAFSKCSSLTSITIPNSVTKIGWDAFNGCFNLTSVYCKSRKPPILSSYVFDNNAHNRKIYVPYISVDAYKLDCCNDFPTEFKSGWGVYAKDIVGYYVF